MGERRYFAQRSIADGRPYLWIGQTDGPNIKKVVQHPFLWTARLHAWWLARRETRDE